MQVRRCSAGWKSLPSIRVRYWISSVSVRVRQSPIRTVYVCNQGVDYVEGGSFRAEGQRRAMALRRIRLRIHIYEYEITYLKTLHFDVRPRPYSDQNHSDSNGGKRLRISITSEQAARYNEARTHVYVMQNTLLRVFLSWPPCSEDWESCKIVYEETRTIVLVTEVKCNLQGNGASDEHTYIGDPEPSS